MLALPCSTLRAHAERGRAWTPLPPRASLAGAPIAQMGQSVTGRGALGGSPSQRTADVLRCVALRGMAGRVPSPRRSGNAVAPEGLARALRGPPVLAEAQRAHRPRAEHRAAPARGGAATPPLAAPTATTMRTRHVRRRRSLGSATALTTRPRRTSTTETRRMSPSAQERSAADVARARRLRAPGALAHGGSGWVDDWVGGSVVCVGLVAVSVSAWVLRSAGPCAARTCGHSLLPSSVHRSSFRPAC